MRTTPSSSSSSSSSPPGLAYAELGPPCAPPAPAGGPSAPASSPSSKYALLPPRLAAARRRSSSSRSAAAPGSAALRAARRIAASSPSSSSLMPDTREEREAKAALYRHHRYSHTRAPCMPKPLPADNTSRLNSRAAAVFIATGCFCFAASRKAPQRAQASFPALPAYETPMAAAVMLSAVERSAVVDRVRGALWGIHIADALSMPVHWYAGHPRQRRAPACSRSSQVLRPPRAAARLWAYHRLCAAEEGAPELHHGWCVAPCWQTCAPLTLASRAVSNTGGHGRGGQSGRIIGDVINHGKHEFWVRANAARPFVVGTGCPPALG